MTESEKWMALVLTVGVGWLIYLLAPILTPFAIAALLAYLGDPLADWLEKWRLGRTGAVVVVFVVLTLLFGTLLLILVPLLEDQIVQLVKRMPAILQWLETTLRSLAARFVGPDVDLFNVDQLVAMAKDHYQQVGGIAAKIFNSLSRSGMALLAWTMNLVLIPVVAFYLLRDWDKLLAHLKGLLPRNVEATVVKLVQESDQVLGAFLRGQLSVMLALGIIYSVGLWIVGVDLALLIGMVAGLISFVPYLGTIVGVGAGVVAALFQFQDVIHLVWVLVVFGIGQMLEGYVLTPKLVGDKIGLHPVAVIFAILAGGQLFGFLGVLIALPAAAVIMVLLRHLAARYKESRLYGSQPEPGPEASP